MPDIPGISGSFSISALIVGVISALTANPTSD